MIERLERRALFAAVASVSPADLGIGVAVNAHVSIKFSSGMQRASLDSTTLELRHNTTQIPARISYNANSFTATIDSTSPLDYSNTYNVLVKGGANGVIDSGSGTLVSDYTFSFTTAANPTTGPGGPILVITNPSNPFSSYYPEILRAEGLNEFATAQISTVTASSLLNYKVVILGEMTLTGAQATTISNWVTNDGGKLIAMRPDAQLAGLLGLTVTGATINDTYLSVDPSTSIGGGITSDSMQYHSTADRYTLSGATKLADLFSNSTTATGNPAVTIKNVGSNGGQAAAFVFDLAKSVVQTRQGNPAWAGQERDGNVPIRSDDLFFGGGGSPDWVDLTKVQIPQADEQQRLLANMINQMTAPVLPLPRFWYLPNGKKAVVNMTGDDHLNGGTAYRWSAYLSLGNSGGQPILGTSYMYAGPGAITDSTAAYYQALGFDPQLHIEVADASDNPRNWTSYADLDSIYSSEAAAYTAFYTSIPTPTTNRTHAIVWSDYDSQPQVEFAHRMRLDANYYYYPGSWLANRPGLFTGSGLPMRFTKADGTLIDVYQATTQITDENGATEPYHINTLLDNATGSKGYYGAFTVNAHTDLPNSAVSDAVIASAQAHDIPVMTAEDLMEWTDARNGSSFSNHAYNTTTHVLTFNITTAAGAVGLQAMVPLVADNNRNVSAISVNGSPVAFNVQTIKGVGYAFFNATAGAVSVTYSADTTAPTVTGKTPAAGATNVSILAHPTVTMSEDVNPATATFSLTDSLTNAVSGAVSYVAGTHTFTFTPNSSLTAGGTYTLKLAGAQDLAGNAMAGTTTWTFTVAGSGPFSIWDNSVTPQMPYFADGSIEVGMKFQADYDGFITGIRFYKAAQNNGTHIGSLYNTAGFSLAAATFTGETSSGWQTVTFDTPVAISANTTYIAAYHTDTGYAADPSYFDHQFDSLYLHAVADSTSGGNGLYRYTSTPLMPNSSFHATNYWVDVVYQLSATDVTPPTITSTNPANNVTGVPVATTVSAVFSEPVQSGTISFILKDPANNVVAGSTSYNSGTRTVTFTPTSALSGSTVYTATISGAQDTAGNPMSAPVSWAFGTADTTPPTVTSHTPLTNATAVAVNTTVTATFSEAVQSGTIVFTLKDPGNNTVAGSTSYNTSTHIATFTPTASLSDVTVYTASVSGAQDISGNAMTAPVTWSFTTTDSTPPTVTSHTPATNATNIAINTTVTATFSEAVQSGTISFTLKDAGNNNVAGSVSYNSTSHVATFTPTAPLSDLTVYTATVSGAQDATGNPMSAPVTWSFTTADSTPPTVTSHTPLSGATNVAVNSTVIATFSEAVQSGTITFTLDDPQNNSVAGTSNYNSTTHVITFTPSAPLVGSTVYTATVSGAQDLAGNAMAAPVSWTFTTADNIAPTVTAKSPAAGATNVPLSATISATFSEAVQSGTISFLLEDAANNNVAGSVAYNTTTHIATFTPTAPLTELTTYTATVSGAQDVSGNPMAAPVTWSFTTLDATAPTVIAQSPLSNAANVAVNAVASATFSEAVQSGTIAFTLKDASNNDVAGTVSYNTSTHVVTFTPTSSLVGSTTYTATVSGAQDTSGNAMAAPDSWSFTTIDNTPPTVTGHTPLSNATNVAVGSTVTATFDEAVQAGTLTLTLKDAGNNDVAGTVGYNSATHVVTFTPTAPLAGSTTFTATVSGAQDTTGNTMAAPVAWSFTTADITAPTVTATSPAAGATNVPVAATVSATFSEAVQSGTISFIVKDAANNDVAGAVTYDAGTHTATFTPTSPFAGESGYTATVSAAQDMSGNAMAAPHGWSFTTIDNTPPVVSAHSPLSNASNVSAGAVITATFNENVQAGTITFTLKDALDQNVSGVVTYDSPTRTATFTPSAPLSGSTTYTATVSGAQDLAGNPLAAPLTWSFSTADATAPTAAAGSELPAPGAATFDFTVTYTDAGSGLDATTFDDNDMTVTGPNGFSANAAFISVNTPGNGSPRIVTYRITAPGGLWNVLDNGTYTITLNANQVKDSSNNAAASGSIRTFNPALPFAYQTGTTVHVDFYDSIPGITLDATVGDVTASDGTTTLSFSSVTSVLVTGTANADTLNFNGPVSPSVAFAGGAGADVLNVNAGVYTFGTDAGLSTPDLTINVNGGSVLFNATQHLATLNIANGAKATFAANGNRALYTTNLSIGASGTLDLNDNDLIVSNGNFATLQALVLGGYHGSPDTTATGIVSTTSQTVHGGTTILALFDNSLAGFSDFPFGSGHTISPNAIVGKYTYIGDTNYDGQVTPQDYTAVDANLNTSVDPGISWFYGDTNFDGNIDASDYTGIDAALGLGVGNPLAALVTRPISPFTGAFFSRNLIDASVLDEV